MSKCIRCNENEKAEGAYKYCTECKEIANYESDMRSRLKRNPPQFKPCEECEYIMTKSKYCYKCAPKVHRRQNVERQRIAREKARDLCERCHEKEKWSISGTAKYCHTCKEIVAKEVEIERVKMNRQNRQAHARKKPIHKGVKLDPDNQKPKSPPKMIDSKGGINPYFLKRHA